MIQFERFDFEKHNNLVEPLTKLLHQAYAPLAAKGMRYLATHQPPSKTLERLQEGESYLAFFENEIVGTVTLYKPDPENFCEYYRKPKVFSFGQFGIKSDLQGQGLGSLMMTMLEARAKELGAEELALDTSEHATDLIRMYEKRGYKRVDYTTWAEVNYRSVILSKPLSGESSARRHP